MHVLGRIPPPPRRYRRDSTTGSIDAAPPPDSGKSIEQDIIVGLVEVSRKWPELSIKPQPFSRHCNSIFDPESRNGGDQPRLAPSRVAELYLAWCCAQGHAHAIARLLTLLRPVLRDHAGHGPDADDRRQRALAHLLVAEPDRQPRIASYRGRATLPNWTAVVLRRLRGARVRRLHLPAPRPLGEIPTDEDPEQELLRRAHAQRFTRAWSRAVTSLDSRQHALLRRISSGQSATEVAADYGVHRATAKRWLAELRRCLRRRTLLHLGGDPTIVPDRFDEPFPSDGE